MKGMAVDGGKVISSTLVAADRVRIGADVQLGVLVGDPGRNDFRSCCMPNQLSCNY